MRRPLLNQLQLQHGIFTKQIINSSLSGGKGFFPQVFVHVHEAPLGGMVGEGGGADPLPKDRED